MSEGQPALHPFETDAGRDILRDLQDAANAAQWHEAVARLVDLLAVSAEGGRPSDPALLLGALRVRAFVAAGPKLRGKRPDRIQARDDAAAIRAHLGEAATRADAASLFVRQELDRLAARVRDPDAKMQRARDAAQKRADRAAKLGGAALRVRPKRK